MYRPGEIAHWSAAELVELWGERAAIRFPEEESEDETRSETDSRAVAENSAAREIQRWCGKPWPEMPQEIRAAAARKFKTAELFD